MRELSITQKAACEALWRALDERGVDMTGFGLEGRTPEDQRDMIVHIVRLGNTAVLDNLTHIEVQRHGPLKSGYGLRWGKQYADNQHDAKTPPPYTP